MVGKGGGGPREYLPQRGVLVSVIFPIRIYKFLFVRWFGSEPPSPPRTRTYISMCLKLQRYEGQVIHFLPTLQVIDGMIFAMGGFNGVTTIYAVECYDPICDEWYVIKRFIKEAEWLTQLADIFKLMKTSLI